MFRVICLLVFTVTFFLGSPIDAKYKPRPEEEVVDTINGAEVKNTYLTGSTRVESTSGYFFANIMAQGGRRGYFLIDFAAGSTVVKKSFLLDTITIHQPEDNADMASIMGLGGKVNNYLGSCTMSRLDLGSIQFKNVKVEVVKDLPPVGNRKISGILGLDLLSKARVVSIDIKRGENKPSRMRFTQSDKLRTLGNTRIPFISIGNHIFIRLEINNKSIQFLFDTGSRESFIPSELASSVGLNIDTTYKKQFYGLDENTIEAQLGIAGNMKVGNSEFENVRFFVPEKPMIQEKITRRKFGILGNEFIRHFTTMEINFRKQTITLKE